ncbi:uncharacterized protein LOC111880341 [Lactuca sativa]|uniref:Maternal effect embryo arrest 59 n=1 Tax=Lactuca sativa TaxID=4236 RepID=A0A9R1WY33_LACSA|nr:uncharacterized protein LOC111880341 [Lactuca sativa]KAJ0193330.1 hypothetical protein LSAT_V11C800417990 [Lactuca sativa]
MEAGNSRPNRSDAHLSKEEEAKIEGETRDYFDGLAPRRHTKPQRSEYSSKYVDGLGLPNDEDDGVSPEYLEFQHLEQNSEKIVYTGKDVSDEFVETEYYKDLNGVDKQHHTTGTGFIKVDDTNKAGFELGSESENAHHASCKGNPATNEWTPAPADMGSFVSDKPQRSDN